MTDSDERRIAKALQGLEFPAAESDPGPYAEDRGVAERALRTLGSLPEDGHGSSEEVERAVPQRPGEELPN
ncbi:hypothetical protein DFQ14_104292 [Halopolyspora algeriensis]|uniref:DUF2795 domain-containing protein n=1 Tax=Halopolyspora algeriensis TaxID=1500506 RepID=A0A368VSI5_9ACTN|nr:DUF2795 domain-containing protein [Halopolyspora algeriensis]RCW44701.1 hypothetical protein DFQ14_104292 [Halopolyspora algeriensis]TQM56058.1 hypothetical protein FHU43_0842 [Halopolyspora algeriensis]